MDREKVVRAFEQYIYNFVELTTTDEYNHQILEQVLVLLKEHGAEIEQLNRFVNGFSRDAMPVVRCKDCDNKECWGRAGDVVCGIDGTPHRPDWFCADGKRREYVKPPTESATDWDGVECE